MQKNRKKMDVKKLYMKVRQAQTQFRTILQDGSWMDDAKKYVERQGAEMQKLIHGDLEKLRTFVEHERRELNRIQKEFPKEVTRWKKYLASQRKELEKLLTGVRGFTPKKAPKRRKAGAKGVAPKKRTVRKRAEQPGSV